MINQMKSYYAVYKPAIGIALIISFLLSVGVISGFFVAKTVDKRALADLNETHIAEVSRMQTSNREVIVYLTTRMQELIEEQSRLAALVAEGVREARGYADSAASSSAEAASSARPAKSSIRIKETPVPEQKSPVEDRHQFPERIEH